MSHFAPVRVNDTLVLDFDTRTTFEPDHYAFKVSDPDFDAIFQRIEHEGIAYGSGPRSPDDMAINHRVEDAGSTLRIRMGICWKVLTAYHRMGHASSLSSALRGSLAGASFAGCMRAGVPCGLRRDMPIRAERCSGPMIRVCDPSEPISGRHNRWPTRWRTCTAW